MMKRDLLLAIGLVMVVITVGAIGCTTGLASQNGGFTAVS